MIRHTPSPAVSFAVLLFVIVASASFALAGSVLVSPVAGPPTIKIAIVGSGFTPGETVTLTFDLSPAGSATVDPSGNFKQRFAVPKTAQPGAHTVQGTGESSGTVASATFTVQTNWPAFKNVPARVGVNSFENTIDRNNAKFLTLAWVGVMGDLVDFSSAAVVNGVVYIGSFDGKLYAFDANGCAPQTTCQPLWSGATNNDIVNSPAVANGVVYIGSADRNLYAFPAKGCGKSTCAPLWIGPVGGGILESSPLVANGVVYVGATDKKLYAFAATGCGGHSCAPLWTATTGGQITSSPAVANGVVYVGSQDGKLYAFTASGCGGSTCSPLWTAQAGSSIIESGPAVSNGVVYIG
ncbi:MAG: PQQ-binding-like beta-propeller repeat protein, partial [Candidatus Sulfotelmatobacter sp.]